MKLKAYKLKGESSKLKAGKVKAES